MWRLQPVAVHRLDDIWIAPETFANANGIVAGLSQHMTRLGEYREVLFWLLLLGSWQFLASPGAKSAVVGASGALMFLLFAFRNLGRLTRLGLGYASWRPTSRAKWALGAASGLIAGIVIFGIGSASGQGMILSSNWRLALLQVTLGPVLEEVVFRGYLFSLLTWALRRAASGAVYQDAIAQSDRGMNAACEAVPGKCLGISMQNSRLAGLLLLAGVNGG